MRLLLQKHFSVKSIYACLSSESETPWHVSSHNFPEYEKTVFKSYFKAVLYGTYCNEDIFICQILFQNPEACFGIGLCLILRHLKNVLNHPKLYRYCSLWLLSLMATHWDFDFSSVFIKITCSKCCHLSRSTYFLYFKICKLRNTTEWNCISWGFKIALRLNVFSPYTKEQ